MRISCIIWYHRSMEHPEPTERHQRPELDRNRPAELFTYAKDKLRYLRERVNAYHLPSSVEHLSDELEAYISDVFESMPAVTVVSSDIEYTRKLERRGSEHVLDISGLPFTGDAELLQAHTIEGLLYGFHKGQNDDLRAYVSLNEGVRKLNGGIYTPLLSVNVEHSDITFTEMSAEEELEEIGARITEMLSDYGAEVKNVVSNLLNRINQPATVAAKKLHEISPILAEIARYENTVPHFVDTILEYVKYRLKLSQPQDISTSSYREVMTEFYVTSFKPRKEPTIFRGITPEVGLIGESANRSLALMFIHNDKALQIPVQYITSLEKSV